MKVGVIGYTNVAPLLYNLKNIELVRGVPTEINSALLNGDVDLANISAIEFIKHSDSLRALPDFSVSVLGSVYSVNLFSKLPWHELDGKTICVTNQSATSVELLKTLLKLDNIKAKLEVSDSNLKSLLIDYPAVLLIGDDALREWYRICGPIDEKKQMFRLPAIGQLNDETIEVIDLAQMWFKKTNLPFVFAVWASPIDSEPSFEIIDQMRQARRFGIGHLAEISCVEAVRLGLPERIIQHYLWNFRYHLEDPDKKGLQKFAQLSDLQANLTFWNL